MSRLLSDITRAEHLLPGREILSVEIISSDDPADQNEPSMVIHLNGMKIYADSVSIYSDDSGDSVEAF